MSVTSIWREPQQPVAPIGDVISLQHVVVSRFIWLDFVERTVVLTMFGVFALRLTAAFQLTTNIAIPLLLISEILPVLLIAFRKWSSKHAMSVNPFDWLLAFAGANTPMLVEAAGHGSVVPQELCSVLILGGLLIQISGYTIAHIGFLLAFPSFWNLAVYGGALLVQIARLLREEQILLTDPSYRQFARQVRYRLLPGVF